MYRLKGGEQGWQIVGSLEAKERSGLGDAREESALNMFRQMDLKGKTKDDTQLKTVHQNTIATLRTYEETGGAVRKFSSESSRAANTFVLVLTCGSERCRWKSGYMVYIANENWVTNETSSQKALID